MLSHSHLRIFMAYLNLVTGGQMSFHLTPATNKSSVSEKGKFVLLLQPWYEIITYTIHFATKVSVLARFMVYCSSLEQALGDRKLLKILEWF